MAESILLNGKKIDLYNKPITRKLQIGDVGDIASRKSSYSYTVKIPRTANNVSILDQIGVQGNTSRKPFEFVSCDYILDSVYLVRNGLAVIKKTSKDIELNIIDGIRGLGDILGDKKIASLPLDDLNHILTTQNYVDSYANTSGYIYAIADFGKGAYSALKVETQAPSIYLHTIVERIFSANELTLQGDFFTTNNDYLKEVIPPAKGYAITQQETTLVPKGGFTSNTISDYQRSDEWMSEIVPFDLSNNNLIDFEIDANSNLKCLTNGVYTFSVDITYNLYSTYAGISTKVNGFQSAFQGLDNPNSSGVNTMLITLNLKANDIVSFEASVYSEFEGDVYFLNYTLSLDATISLNDGGQLIKPKDYIADLKQIDVIKDLANRYGLVLHPVQNTNEFKFGRLENILHDREGAQDWTKKLSSINSEVYNSGYAQTNRAKYNYPETIVEPNNDGEILIDNYNTNTEKTLFTSIYEIANTADEMEGEQVYSVPIFNTEDELLETSPKIMSITRTDINIEASLFDEATGIVVNSNVPFLGLENISLQYLLGNFYKSFKSLINNYKKVSANLNLSVVDVFNLDFFKLKYLRQTGRFYYLNSVNFTAGKLAQLDMLEIQEFPQNQPPSQYEGSELSLNHGQQVYLTEANFTVNYEDPEGDKPYMLKLLNGFNDSVELFQNNVLITAEQEILFSELDLRAIEKQGGVEGYTQAWDFKVSDKGSKEYGATARLTINVQEMENTAPVAVAQAFSRVVLPPYEFNEEGMTALIGGQSYDFTGLIVSWEWSFVSKPSGSNAYITNEVGPDAELWFPAQNDDNIGTYVVKLTVTDNYGLTGEDQAQIITEYMTQN